ncbi:radical SAM protein [Streptomyces sp. NPDC051917]|uniref:B12-binding domain-containing radical SAM protein n=1 Tax=Streptomyces sp. NPDC051917 TaxID=3154754 RepID=UPI0034551C94
MRVMLIHPGVPEYGGRENFRAHYPPLGLACVAAPLVRTGHEVIVVDCAAERLSDQDVVRRVADYGADVVGFRCQFINYPLGLHIAKEIKKAHPEVAVIFGGPHMGLVAEQGLRDHPYIDAMVHGEGEHALLEYVQALPSGNLDSIKGLAWRKQDGTVVHNGRREVRNGPMDFPQPAFEVLPMHLYRLANFFSLEGHRGCPMKCTFCALPQVQTRRVRYKKPEALVAEMETLVQDYGINRFDFIEVNFTIKKSWAHEVCDLIIERRLPVQWICRSYPELVDPAVLHKLKAAGCYRINYGIESGSAEVLRNYRKVTTVRQGLDAIRWSKDAGLTVYVDYLIGGPGETSATVEETIDFHHAAQPHFADVSMVVPFPMTPIYDSPEEFGVRVTDDRWFEDLEQTSKFPFVRAMELKHLQKGELERLWLHAVRNIMFDEEAMT